jgi:beta-RFAP synthase
MSHVVHVRAPCRLHFGMFGFGHADRPQFGGVGVMVEPPAVEMRIAPAEEFHVTGQLANRAQQYVKSAISAWGLPHLPACELNIRSPSNHVGLGVGTQLGLAIAAGMRRFLMLPERAVELLAGDVGRGSRSAVGTYGFQHGGLIVDAGHEPGERLGKLSRRVEMPADWRFVLACPANERGLAGQIEADAFSRLPAVPEPVTRQLWQITAGEMLPAVDRRDCRRFGEAVYQFGRLAGECFSAVQGGPFASRDLASLIGVIRDYGVAGVGQSSWGPTVFAVCPSESDAQALARWMSEDLKLRETEISIACPNNRGAEIK